jgi:hypothetical protein
MSEFANAVGMRYVTSLPHTIFMISMPLSLPKPPSVSPKHPKEGSRVATFHRENSLN